MLIRCVFYQEISREETSRPANRASESEKNQQRWDVLPDVRFAVRQTGPMEITQYICHCWKAPHPNKKNKNKNKHKNKKQKKRTGNRTHMEKQPKT